MVKMADVAKIAGVSVSTVSHVLNDTRAVRAETRAAVLAAIEQTGYTQNTIARALVTASSGLIGLSIPVITNPYFTDVIHAIETNVSATSYTLILADSREDPEHELRALRALLQRRIDGLIIVPAGGDNQLALEHLAASSVPTVLIDRLASADFDQVGPDNEEPTAQLVEHLADLGHHRIGMVAGLSGLTTTRERLAGYRRGLDRHGLPYDEKLVAGGGSQIEGARAAAHTLLALPNPPTALVVANNLMTIGTMHALRETGRRVPDDIALTCFDDFEWADLFSPRLTTMAQPRVELGNVAVELLMRRLADPTVPPRTVRLAPQFMHRDSCGCTPEQRMATGQDKEVGSPSSPPV
ncbi:transcriptional regulator, LacI family [Parafrankia sp. EAN1pec]|uniref:LacI family DNA-binding transcriptional regulator n=1 Tax=Parafrankia sp. (strain EAN1pec) TaxID=298653 RepID=UPI0000544FDA|nr:transcriptional regulator, LacI family [Frankia sp. EAN1pec]